MAVAKMKPASSKAIRSRAKSGNARASKAPALMHAWEPIIVRESQAAGPAPAVPVQAPKPEMPHIGEHLKTRDFFLPLRKLMINESATTYARINPAIQFYQAVVFFIVFAIFLIVSVFAGSIASGIHAPSALVVISLIFLALPFFLAWGIEIAFLPETFRFSLQQEYVFVRHGAIVPSFDLVPYENVQDAQVSQGIVERIFNMATVYVSTPAGMVSIFGISLEDAQEFRKDLLALAKAHRGMAE